MGSPQCAQCGTQNHASARYCAVCGISLAGRPDAGPASQPSAGKLPPTQRMSAQQTAQWQPPSTPGPAVGGAPVRTTYSAPPAMTATPGYDPQATTAPFGSVARYRTGAGPLPYGLAAVGGGLLVMCAFLPWLTISLFTVEVSVNGLGRLSGLGGLAADAAGAGSTSGDGLLALLFGALILGTTIWGVLQGRSVTTQTSGPSERQLALVLSGLGALSACFIVWELISTAGNRSDVQRMLGSAVDLLNGIVSVHAGYGLYVGLLGAVLTIVAGLMSLARR